MRASVTAAKDKRAVPSNLTPDLLNLRDSIADVGDCDYEENVRTLCPHGDGDRSVVVIGDSHARAWIPAFNRIIDVGDWTAYYLVKPQCTAAHVTIASLDSDEPFTDCSDFQDWVIDQVEAIHPDLVVVASSPPVNGVFDGDDRITSVEGIIPLLRAGYDDLFLELSQYADQVALVRDVPKSPDDPATCLSSGSPSLGDCMFEPVERSTVLGDVRRRLGPRLGHRGRRPDAVAVLPGRVPDRHRRHAELPRHRPHHHRVRRQPLERARQRAAHAADDPGVSLRSPLAGARAPTRSRLAVRERFGFPTIW